MPKDLTNAATSVYSTIVKRFRLEKAVTKSEKEQRFAEARRTINRANYIVFRMRSDLDTGLPIDNRQFTAFVSQMTHADEIIRSVFVAQELDRHARTQ